MKKTNLQNLKNLGKDSSVSVADVERVRRQRRLARTEQEYAEVRAHVRDLAGHLRSKPQRNTQLLKISGIAVLVLGLIIGGVLFYVASLAWPSFVLDW